MLPPESDKLLCKILSQPSAPFREMHVQNVIEATLAEAGVPHFRDPIGNIIVGAESKAAYDRLIRKKTRDPIRVFIAHMDHPGFHGASWRPNEGAGGQAELEVQWHGGAPTQHLEGAKVWLASAHGRLADGKILSAKLTGAGRSIESAVLEVAPSLRREFPKPEQLFGGFAFREPVWREGDLLYTKAADDLVGAFCIVSLALKLCKRGKSHPSFLGVLTRAEEVGFIGCIGHLELGWLQKAKRPVLCVSLETSRTLPGADIGKGPVVRLGDRFTVFDSGALRVFSELAQKALPDRHQRRIMDGGTCEATAATAFGFSAVGISVPLGNYHNQSFEGGPDSRGPMGPAPEFVHVGDIEGLLTLGHALLESGVKWEQPWTSKRREFSALSKKYSRLLKPVTR